MQDDAYKDVTERRVLEGKKISELIMSRAGDSNIYVGISRKISLKNMDSTMVSAFALIVELRDRIEILENIIDNNSYNKERDVD